MEIVSLLNLKLWKVVLIGVVALMAASLTSYVALNKADKYSASATVFLAQVFQPTSSNNGDANATNFEAALSLPGVLDPVAKATGVDKDAIATGLRLANSSQGSFLNVSYLDSDPARATAVVRGASQNALKLL